MTDESDISQERAWLYEQRAQMVISNLKKRHMNGQYAPNRKEALSAVLEMIPPGALVARAGSASSEGVGVIPALRKRNQNKLIELPPPDAYHFAGAGSEERQRIMREAFFADILVTGTNAITLDGKLVNVDGIGNRVAAIVFGPRKVIIIVGINKIVQDVTEGLQRIRQFAAPMNARRHHVKHQIAEFGDVPCVRTGSCIDCKHQWRICNYTVIIEGAMPPNQGRINVVLVGEQLGL